MTYLFDYGMILLLKFRIGLSWAIVYKLWLSLDKEKK